MSICRYADNLWRYIPGNGNYYFYRKRPNIEDRIDLSLCIFYTRKPSLNLLSSSGTSWRYCWLLPNTYSPLPAKRILILFRTAMYLAPRHGSQITYVRFPVKLAGACISLLKKQSPINTLHGTAFSLWLLILPWMLTNGRCWSKHLTALSHREMNHRDFDPDLG